MRERRRLRLAAEGREPEKDLPQEDSIDGAIGLEAQQKNAVPAAPDIRITAQASMK
jgi:hypothetical protein